MNDKCPYCGAKTAATANDGVACFIRDTDIALLSALFWHEIDDVKCEGCERSLRVVPTVAVRFTERRRLVVRVGSNLRRSGDDFDRFIRSGFANIDDDFAVEKVDVMSPFLEVIAGYLKETIQKGEWALATVSEPTKLASRMEFDWVQLTPSFFAAAMVVVASPVPGIRFGSSEDEISLSQDDIIAKLGMLQSMALITMMLTLTESASPKRSLERELAQYIDPGVFIPGAVQTLSVVVEQQRASAPDLEIRYVWEALWAAVCVAAGVENTRSKLWASAYFDYELATYVNKDRLPDEWLTLSLPSDRARATLSYELVLDNVVARYSATDQAWFDAIQHVLTRAGYPEISFDLVKSSSQRAVKPKLGINASDLLSVISQATAVYGATDNLTMVAAPYITHFIEQNLFADVDATVAGLIELLGGSPHARCVIEVWIGSLYKERGLPARFISRVGDCPAEWEDLLDAGDKVRLWNERSNALRLLGRSQEALQTNYEVMELLEGMPASERLRRVAMLNQSILLREVGYPDESIRILTVLSIEALPPELLNILKSLAVTYISIGRGVEALDCIEEALKIARGPLIDEQLSLSLCKAAILASQERPDEALSCMLAVSFDSNDLEASVLEASAWGCLLESNVPLPQSAIDRIKGLGVRLRDAFEHFVENSTPRGAMDVLRLTAELSEFTGDNPEEVWQKLFLFAHEWGQPPQAPELIWLALYAYERSDFLVARGLLGYVPSSLISQVGGARDSELVLTSSQRFTYPLKLLTRKVLELVDQGAVEWEDVRLVSELNRDCVGRAQRFFRRTSRQTSAEYILDLSPESISALASAAERVIVLEWIGQENYISPFLTIVSSTGDIDSTWIDPPQQDLVRLCSKTRSRLAGWHSGRPGDPFDATDWEEFSIWFSESIGSLLRDNDHIVFIDHQMIAGLPWHVLAGPFCTASYATGWSTIMPHTNSVSTSGIRGVGVAAVCRFNEQESFRDSVLSSAARTRVLSDSLHLDFQFSQQEACDRSAIEHMFATSDVAKLMLHGFVAPDDREVAFLVAADGTLPLANSIAASSSLGRKHRLSWREFQFYERSPRVVFSAACSSGIAHTAGLGEQLGVFGSLRKAGTDSVVAPRWDIIAGSVLPILDNALEDFLSGKANLAMSVRSASLMAAESLPQWIAWSLAIEGAWR